MWEKIKEFLGIVGNTNLTTPRECLSSFVKALDKCDVNEDGMVNVKELLKLYKDTSIKSIVRYEMTSEELKLWLDDFCKRM